jgi:hypothetical protein
MFLDHVFVCPMSLWIFHGTKAKKEVLRYAPFIPLCTVNPKIPRISLMMKTVSFTIRTLDHTVASSNDFLSDNNTAQ